jgi:hypothetical protein
MKIAPIKTPPAATASETTMLAAITAQIEDLGATTAKLRLADKALVAEDIAIHGAGAPAGDDIVRRGALELLDGKADGAPQPKSKSERLAEITAERQKIAMALEIADGRITRLFFDRAIEMRKLIADDWAEVQRERALAVARLQGLNRRAQRLLAKVIDPYGRAEMPASFSARPAALFLLGNGQHTGGDGYDFLRVCVEAGILTKGEIEREAQAIDDAETSHDGAQGK